MRRSGAGGKGLPEVLNVAAGVFRGAGDVAVGVDQVGRRVVLRGIAGRERADHAADAVGLLAPPAAALCPSALHICLWCRPCPSPVWAGIPSPAVGASVAESRRRVKACAHCWLCREVPHTPDLPNYRAGMAHAVEQQPARDLAAFVRASIWHWQGYSVQVHNSALCCPLVDDGSTGSLEPPPDRLDELVRANSEVEYICGPHILPALNRQDG